MPSPMHSPPHPGIRSRSSKACTTCRQVKLRCDATTTFPGPCSRCRAAGRVCVVNPSFKRTPTRNQLDSLAHEVDSLRQLLGAPSRPTPESLPRGIREDRLPVVANRNGTLNGDNGPSLFVSETSPQDPDDMFGLGPAYSGLDPVIPSHLGDVEFTPDDFLDLFNFYLQHQYYHLPILNRRTPIGTMQKNTPLLFWTIIVVSCRYHRNLCHRFPLLRDPYHELLGKALTTSPMSLCTIQATLLLCYWPFPCAKQPQDPSWNYCGIAINAALYLGLDSPKDHQLSKLSAEELNIRSKTWLACFYIGTFLSVRMGVSPPIQSSTSLTVVANMIEKVDLPETFAIQVEIQRHVARYMAALTGDQDYAFNLAAMKIFERELDSISLRFKNAWNAESEFSLLKAKLSLYALACISSPAPDPSASLSMSRPNNDHDLDMSKLAGLYFASKLIGLFSEIVDTKAAITKSLPTSDLNTDNSPSPCIPKFYALSMYFAAFFLLKFCAFNSRLSQDDRDTAENSIKMAYDILLRTSTHPLDESGRTAKVVEVLSKTDESALRIKDRHDASIIYDSLQRAAELRGRRTDEPIPEIRLGDEHPTSNNDPSEVSMANTDENLALPRLEDLDPWISYLGIPGESWPFGDLDM